MEEAKILIVSSGPDGRLVSQDELVGNAGTEKRSKRLLLPLMS